MPIDIVTKGNVVILNIEPYSILGSLLRNNWVRKCYCLLSLKQNFNIFLGMQGDFSLDRLWFESQTHWFSLWIPESGMPSHLFMSILKWKTTRLRRLLHHVLSPSRLATLFKQQGSSISKIPVVDRLKMRFSKFWRERQNLTTIALEEKWFYDSSQMTKYMYQLFGISPSKLKQKVIWYNFFVIETPNFVILLNLVT